MTRVKESVSRLDIPVDQVGGMDSVETVTELLAPAHGLLWRHAPRIRGIFEISAGHERCRDVPEVAAWDDIGI